MKLANIYDSAAPYIACFVILRRENKIAMVLRQNTGWKDGYYGLPAGKVEWQESYTSAAVREAKEEAGVDIKISDLRFVHVAHRHADDGKEFMDWVDIYFEALSWQGEPYNAEEHKSSELAWIEVDNLPETIVPSQHDALTRIANGEYYSEYGWPK